MEQHSIHFGLLAIFLSKMIFPSVALYYKSMCKSHTWLSLGKNKAKDEPNIVRWDLPVR